MGETSVFKGKEAGFPEQSGPAGVRLGGGSHLRRPEHSGASAKEGPGHESNPQTNCARPSPGSAPPERPARRDSARPRRKWVVRVCAIDPQKYPDLRKNPENPFAGMGPEQRLEEISAFCALLWARTCADVAREERENQKAAA